MRTADTLRPIAAGRLLDIWRAVAAEEENEAVRGLRCNARVLAACCYTGEERTFSDERAALDALTAREMEGLLRRLAGEPLPTPGTANPGFDEGRFQALRGENA